jgi:hypothetical protein
MTDVLRSPRGDSSGQGVPRHTRGSADRCSLPGLAGLADSRRVGPSLHHHSSGLNSTRRHLGRGFRLAGADCEYRAPLPPRLARPRSIMRCPALHLAQGMAEREGFEPSTRLLDVYTISSRAPSAARAPLPGPRDARSATPRSKKMAEGVGFEPTWGLITPNSISSRARCDHFGTPPHVAPGKTPAPARPLRRRARRRGREPDGSTPARRGSGPG